MPKTTECGICNFNARKCQELSGIIKNRMQQKFGHKDFKKLELGFEVAGNFLTIGGPQPAMADLVVLAQKLELQIRFNSIDLVKIEDAKPAGK